MGGTDGRTVGHVQLYSVAQKGSHPVDAHACCFMRLKKPGGVADAVLFCFASRNDAGQGQVGRGDCDGREVVLSVYLLFRFSFNLCLSHCVAF
jgi:hypothetical protein